MERLTKTLINGAVLCNFGFINPEKCDRDCGRCPHGTRAFKKLAEYEDLEEQGLLIRLPCKVGEVVYHERPYVTLHTGIQAFQITNIMISQNKKGIWSKKYRAMHLLNGKIIDSQINFSFDDIGKTVFLTREEAEAALERMNEDA